MANLSSVPKANEQDKLLISNSGFSIEELNDLTEKIKTVPNADIWTRAKIDFLSQRSTGPRSDFLKYSMQISDQLVLAFRSGRNSYVSAFSHLITDKEIPLHLFVKRDMAILLAASVSEAELRDPSKTHNRITPSSTIGKLAIEASKLLSQAEKIETKGAPYANVTQFSHIRTYRRMSALGLEQPQRILRIIADGEHPLYDSPNVIALAASRDTATIF